MVKTKLPQTFTKHLAYDIVKYPLSTEKSVRLMEAENKLVFIVRDNASQTQVKEAVESLFNVKVQKVNLLINSKNQKKAYVRLSHDTLAIDVATDLGLI